MLRSKLTAGVFAVLIFGLAIAHMVLPDAGISVSERRKLKQAPALSAGALVSGDYSGALEDYLLDQFPARDGFRTIKAMLRFYVFLQSDNNGIFIADGSVFKQEYPLKQDQVEYAGNKVAELTELYLGGMNVYYSVIPDKSHFVAEESGQLSMDYGELLDVFSARLPEGITYIDIMGLLTAEDYYRTDSHWQQQCILPVAEKLADAMGVHEYFLDESAYTQHTLSPFYGVYCGQSALPVRPDTLVYLTSRYTDFATVTGIELDGEKPVYTVDRFGGLDGYDVFLSGAQSVITIDVPNAGTDRELIIFRDSFASSLAPLLIGAYSRITLIDLRYISSSLVGDYVDFTDQDVLFMYSTSLINSGMLLK